MKSSNIPSKSGKINKIKAEKAFERILSFLPNKEIICVLPILNKQWKEYFLNSIEKKTINKCLIDLKKKVSSINEFKSLIFNHSTSLDDQIKEVKNKYDNENKFLLYRSLYMFPYLLFKDMGNLDLQKQNIGYDGVLVILYLIKKTKNLTHLNLSYNNLNDNGLMFLSEALASNNTIQSLSLECNGIRNKGFVSLGKAIKKHKNINTIKLALNMITYEGAVSFTENVGEPENMKCKNLKVVDLKYNNIVTKESKDLQYLQKYSYFKK